MATTTKKPKTQPKQDSPYFNYALIGELIDMACLSVEDLIAALNIDCRRNRKMLVGCCPVHGGDNPTAWNLYPEGDDVRGYWKCRTHHCEKIKQDGKLLYGPTLIGLIRGILSYRNGRYATYHEAVDWLVNFLGYKNITDIQEPTKLQVEKRQYAASIRRMNLAPQQSRGGWTRDWFRSMVKIPAEYYLKRGYSAEVLDKYDVGLYNEHSRVVVPVYDDKHDAIIGFVGRSIFDQCTKCSLYHSPQKRCPKTTLEFVEAAKWKNSPPGKFESAHYLYNYWYALPYIRKCNIAILVEGAGDVWRLEENNIHIGLGMFGTDLTEQQRILLDRSGALSLIVLTDPDEAGQKAAIALKEQLGRQYRMYFPTIRDDVGGLNGDEVTNDIKPVLDKINDQNNVGQRA